MNFILIPVALLIFGLIVWYGFKRRQKKYTESLDQRSHPDRERKLVTKKDSSYGHAE